MVYCKMCGRQLSDDYQFCPYCGERNLNNSPSNRSCQEPLPRSGHNSDNNRLITILLLIFVFPYGLLYMWIVRPFTRKTRTIISLSFLLTSFFGLMALIFWTSSPGYLF